MQGQSTITLNHLAAKHTHMEALKVVGKIAERLVLAGSGTCGNTRLAQRYAACICCGSDGADVLTRSRTKRRCRSGGVRRATAA